MCSRKPVPISFQIKKLPHYPCISAVPSAVLQRRLIFKSCGTSPLERSPANRCVPVFFQAIPHISCEKPALISGIPGHTGPFVSIDPKDKAFFMRHTHLPDKFRFQYSTSTGKEQSFQTRFLCALWPHMAPRRHRNNSRFLFPFALATLL